MMEWIQQPWVEVVVMMVVGGGGETKLALPKRSSWKQQKQQGDQFDQSNKENYKRDAADTKWVSCSFYLENPVTSTRTVSGHHQPPGSPTTHWSSPFSNHIVVLQVLPVSLTMLSAQKCPTINLIPANSPSLPYTLSSMSTSSGTPRQNRIGLMMGQSWGHLTCLLRTSATLFSE